LNDILRISRRAHHAQRVPIKRSLLSSREILERPRVTGARTLDE
jgi:hypothetical protein